MGDNLSFLDRNELESFLQKNNLSPKHSLGQNFLIDAEVLNSILAAGELNSHDTVIEIGSGLGVLTRELAKVVAKVVALEFDAETFVALQKNLAAFSNVELHQIDVRKFTPPQPPYKLIANIPYYLTSPILRQFYSETLHRPEVSVLLIQKEVAEKICAKEKLSVIALQVKVFAEAEIICTVGKESFLPPPKVKSAVIKLTLKKTPEIPQSDIEDFFKLLHMGFHSPRKKIGGSIIAGFPFNKDKTLEILAASKIDTEKRPEDLAISDWQKLLAAYRKFSQ
ncbi:MAG: 16S rRNA (adenine(1518)-N(6)/adenine(1519)-N(6))-dimethyltransferase RsmA [Candidatus Gracilibacteria bacterium]|nr:16S rRNA (adenine(1518)-N(6)/adenine(1519)-N(6))-dimethyltransferase RsmA [Candidatus Gracilibacteria bacterium]MDD5179017.1 16S rRNA (adenine(1518)-N(6)/adenine(1519)-N(6))-dimethyltransferase RsmA [Candidatus Gracilibacteria bacterium]